MYQIIVSTFRSYTENLKKIYFGWTGIFTSNSQQLMNFQLHGHFILTLGRPTSLFIFVKLCGTTILGTILSSNFSSYVQPKTIVSGWTYELKCKEKILYYCLDEFYFCFDNTTHAPKQRSRVNMMARGYNVFLGEPRAIFACWALVPILSWVVKA